MARFKEQRHPRGFDVEIYVTFVGTAVAVAAKIPDVAPPPYQYWRKKRSRYCLERNGSTRLHDTICAAVSCVVHGEIGMRTSQGVPM